MEFDMSEQEQEGNTPVSENLFLSTQSFQDQLTPNLQNLSICHINIRGCRTNFDKFKAYLATLPCNFSIVALTETYITEHNDVGFIIPDYNCMNLYSKHGVKIYLHKTLKCTKVDSLCYSNSVIESLFLSIENSNIKNFNVGVLYRPHSGTILEFNNFFNNNIIDKISTSQRTIITGDFNINLLKRETDNSINEFCDIMQTKRFIPSIYHPTRINRQNVANSSILDHFWSNIYSPYSTYVIENDISDHFPIALIFKSINLNEKVEIKFRDFSARNMHIFHEALPHICQTYNGNLEDPNRATDDFVNWIFSILDRFFPIRIKKIGIKRFSSPWLNDSILKCVKKKHALYRLMKQNRFSKEAYNKYRNILTSLIRKSKLAYYDNVFARARGNISDTWKTINNLLGANTNNKSISKVKIPDTNEETNNLYATANTFNTFFSSIASKLKSNLPILQNLNEFNNFPSISSSIFLKRASPPEVVNIINSLPNKCGNINEFPTKILKSMSDYISFTLCQIFNLIVTRGSYPDILKVARIRPIYKAKDPYDVNNYRPISILSCINKIFERLLLARMNSFIDQFNILSTSQYGFVSGRGTVDAGMDLISKIQKSLSDGKFCIAVFIDLKKAFDTVDFNRLLFKLNKCGFRGIVEQLFASYLTNRQQYVELDGAKSEKLGVSSGVPQGSVLGATLFNLYINDLPYYVGNDSSILYADDTSLVHASEQSSYLFRSMQESINICYRWATANSLTINIEKTNYLYLSPNLNAYTDLTLSLGDTIISRVEYTKYLGVILDDKMKFDKHISQVISRLSRMVSISYSIGNYLNYDAARCLYFSLVQSLLTYMIVFWGCTTEANLNRMQTKQNMIIRNLFGNKIPYQHTIELYRKCTLLNVRCLYKFELGKVLYKTIKCNKFPSLLNVLNGYRFNHQHNTRYYHNYRIPTITSEREAKRLPTSAIRLWNSIPDDVKNSETYSIFAKKLFNYLFGTI